MIISLVFSVLCCVFFVVASFQYGVGCSLPYVHFLFMNPFFFSSLSLFFLLFFLFVRMCVHACVCACMCASVCHLLFDTWIFMFSNNNTVIGYFIGEVLHVVLIRTLVWHWDGGLLQGSIWHSIFSDGGNVNDNKALRLSQLKWKCRETPLHMISDWPCLKFFLFSFFF